MDYRYISDHHGTNCVVCSQCREPKQLGVDDLYRDPVLEEEYTDDGSLVAVQTYTCVECKIHEKRLNFDNMSLNGKDFSRRIDKLQKDLDIIKKKKTEDRFILYFILITIFMNIVLI